MEKTLYQDPYYLMCHYTPLFQSSKAGDKAARVDPLLGIVGLAVFLRRHCFWLSGTSGISSLVVSEDETHV
jgi:hypothetical protein